MVRNGQTWSGIVTAPSGPAQPFQSFGEVRPPTIPNSVSSYSTSLRRRISSSAQPVQQCAQPPYLGAGIPKLLLVPQGAEPLSRVVLSDCPFKASIPSHSLLFILPSPSALPLSPLSPPPLSFLPFPHIVIPFPPYLSSSSNLLFLVFTLLPSSSSGGRPSSIYPVRRDRLWFP